MQTWKLWNMSVLQIASCIPSTEYKSSKDLLYYNNSGLTCYHIVIGNDTEGEEQESQFVELTMCGWGLAQKPMSLWSSIWDSYTVVT